MKSHTRRIWIFIGLKAKEIGIVLAWIVGIGGIGTIIILLIHYICKNWTISVMIFGCLLIIFCLIMVFVDEIKKWIKRNWQRAGTIERKTRKRK